MRGRALRVAVPVALLVACGARSSLLVDGLGGAGTAEPGRDAGGRAPEDASTCAPDVCPVVLAHGQRQPYALAVNGTTVFWTNDPHDPGGSVARVPIGGGIIETLATTVGRAEGLALDAHSVYWTDSGTTAHKANGRVLSMPVAGGVSTTLATRQVYPTAVAVDGPTLYWASSSTAADTLQTLTIYGATAGSKPNASGSFMSANGLAVLDGQAFAANAGAAVTGPGLTQFPQQDPTSVAVVGMDIYWTDRGATASTGAVRTVHGMNDGTFGPVVALASGQTDPDGIAVDSSGVYWTTGSADATTADGTIEWLPAGATKAVTLASQQPAPRRIALDGRNVYWTNRGLGDADGSVMQIAKRNACEGGGCACPPGETTCGAACVDLQSDLANCGGCGDVCDGGASGPGVCSVGHCIVTLSTGRGAPGSLAVTADKVYWTENDNQNGLILSVPPGGGAPSTISTNTEASYIVADTQGVFWSSSVPSVNGSTGVLVEPPQHADPIIALDATYVYYADPILMTVERVPRDEPGASTPILSGAAQPIAVDATSLYSFARQTVDESAFGIIQTPLAGGPPVLLSSLANDDQIAMVVDATSVEWSEWTTGAVMGIPIGGGTPTTLAAGLASAFGNEHWGSLATDGSHTYVGAVADVVGIAAGGAVSVVAPWAGGVSSIGADATHVYWVDAYNGGRVMKATK